MEIKRDNKGRFIKGNTFWDNNNNKKTRFVKGCKHKNRLDNSKDKHWNWKGGKWKYGYQHREWSKQILKKYYYTCQNCGEVGGKLNAHHILNVSSSKKYRFIISNGICLCENCHYLFHRVYGFQNTTVKQLKQFLTYKDGLNEVGGGAN